MKVSNWLVVIIAQLHMLKIIDLTLIIGEFYGIQTNLSKAVILNTYLFL